VTRIDESPRDVQILLRDHIESYEQLELLLLLRAERGLAWTEQALGERLFAFFAVAFIMLAINWLALAAIDPAFEARHVLYLVRLAAFILIIVAIIDKNRALR
jgi:hypothetical protein